MPDQASGTMGCAIGEQECVECIRLFRIEGIEGRQASAGASMASQDFILVSRRTLITRSINGYQRPVPGALPDSQGLPSSISS